MKTQTLWRGVRAYEACQGGWQKNGHAFLPGERVCQVGDFFYGKDMSERGVPASFCVVRDAWGRTFTVRSLDIWPPISTNA